MPQKSVGVVWDMMRICISSNKSAYRNYYIAIKMMKHAF